MLDDRSRAVIDALGPSGHPVFKIGLLEAGFDAFWEDFRRTAPASMVLGFRAALWTASWLSPLLIGALPPLSRLSTEDRARALSAMGGSRFYLLRQLTLVLKAVCGFCYGAHPEVRRAIGYPA